MARHAVICEVISADYWMLVGGKYIRRPDSLRQIMNFPFLLLQISVSAGIYVHLRHVKKINLPNYVSRILLISSFVIKFTVQSNRKTTGGEINRKDETFQFPLYTLVSRYANGDNRLFIKSSILYFSEAIGKKHQTFRVSEQIGFVYGGKERVL